MSPAFADQATFDGARLNILTEKLCFSEAQ
jgi:hypothetical protein